MKKIFSFLTLNILLLLLCAAASAKDLSVTSGISFLASERGTVLRECPDAGKNIYAEAEVKNTSDGDKTAFLYLCKYDGETLKGISFGKKIIPANGQDRVSANIKVENDAEKSFVYKAYIWDGAAGSGACCKEATFSEYPVSLYGITVGGVPIEDYSDAAEEYTVKVSSANERIVLYPTSGAVKMTEVSYNVPGNTVVKLSAGGVTKTVTIKTYTDNEYLYSLSDLRYSLNGREYKIENFDPDVMEYDVVLPENTFYVRVTGTSPGEITYKVQDVNGAPNRIAGVSFGKMRGDTTGVTYTYERLAIDRVIPIKNEETKAIVRVTDGTNVKKYTINFYSKQPRLTEYTLADPNGSYVPVYTSGAALNNDNGSVISADRMWTAANVSKSLIGASYFMSPCNNKNAGELWWGKDYRYRGEEYFRFAADTPGTVIMLSSYDCNMNFEDYPEEVWTKENNGSKPSGISDPRESNKAYNSYASPQYYFNGIEWGTNTDVIRANLGVGAISGAKLTEVKEAAGSTKSYCYAWSKHFEAGESVVIRHTGVQGNAAQAYFWAIIWDGTDVGYPYEEIAGEGSAGGSADPNVVVSYDYQNNDGSGAYNEFSDKWKDLGKNSNDLDTGNVTGSGWSANGFNLVTPDDSLELPDAVEAVLNTGNFTVSFDIADIEGNAAILASDNEKFSVCAEDGYVNVYYGSIVRNPISLPVSEVKKGLSHIVVSSNDSKTAVKFQWYVNGVLKAEKNYIKYVFKDIDTVFLGSKKAKLYNGRICLRKLVIYDCAKSADSIKAELED